MSNTMRYKKYEELDFTDDFMFCKVLTDNPELTKHLAELITGRTIASIGTPEEQKPIRIFADGKGVRFDVYFEDDEKTAYDFEMQTSSDELTLRTRYYQSLIDDRKLMRGASYEDLTNMYIVFVCTYDPFGEGLYRYTFENRCCEKQDLVLDDGVQKIFLNARGTHGEISEDVRLFLQYVAKRQTENSFTNDIEEAIKTAIADREGRRFYMTLLEHYKKEREEGREEGRVEGREEGREEGRFTAFIELVFDKVMTPSQAAERLKISEETFLDRYAAWQAAQKNDAEAAALTDRVLENL